MPIRNARGLYSLSGRTPYRKISKNPEVMRFGFRIFQSFSHLTGTSASELPRCLLQAISVIRADNMIRVAIQRTLVIAMDIPIRHRYFVFRVVLRPRIMKSTRDIAPLAQSIISKVASGCANSVMNRTIPLLYYGFRAPGAVSVMTHHNPKGVTSVPGDFHKRQHNVPIPHRFHTFNCVWSIRERHRHWRMLEMSQNMILVALPRYH